MGIQKKLVMLELNNESLAYLILSAQKNTTIKKHVNNTILTLDDRILVLLPFVLLALVR